MGEKRGEVLGTSFWRGVSIRKKGGLPLISKLSPSFALLDRSKYTIQDMSTLQVELAREKQSMYQNALRVVQIVTHGTFPRAGLNSIGTMMGIFSYVR